MSQRPRTIVFLRTAALVAVLFSEPGYLDLVDVIRQADAAI